ncbi:MAG: glycosyl hydrolase 53 family protein, partial [Rhodothermales bacterium]|nr:glycosyl hydrolase 53 family protein [Rhodothermales bacterium]
WSSAPLHHLPDYISRLKMSFGRDVIVLETGYPWTFTANDGANNILGVEALQLGYPATPDGQSRYLRDLMQAVLDGGGSGIVYWEPAWISTACSTRWGQGSHWENATFFDFDNGNELLPAIDFLNANYVTDRVVPIELRVNAGGQDVSRGIYVAGDMTYDSTGSWQAVGMEDIGSNIYRTSFDLRANTAYRLNFYNGPNLGQDKEALSFRCAGSRGDNRLISVQETSGEFAFDFGACSAEDLVDVTLQVDMTGQNVSSGVYVAGDLTRNTADQWTFRSMQNVGGNIYAASFSLVRGGRYPFAFYTGTTWAPSEKESIPHPCAPAWGTHRMLEVPEDAQAIRYRFGNCLVTDATNADPIPPPQSPSRLLPHYPNPADGAMTFVYELSEPASVRLSVFDLLGREVAVIDEGQRMPVRYEIEFDVRSLPAGLYFYRLVAGENSEGRSIIVL